MINKILLFYFLFIIFSSYFKTIITYFISWSIIH